MGWAKYTEDIRRDVDINLERINPVEIQARPLQVLSYQCFYCNETFSSNDELFSHMREQHNTLDTVIQLNGRIYEPGEYIEVEIESIRLFPVKSIHTFTLNGNSYEAVIKNGYIDIPPYLYSDCKQVVLDVDNRKWIVYKNRSCKVSCNVNSVIADLNEAVINCQRPDLERLKQQIRAEALDVLDEQYVYAFYEYYLACMITGAEKDKDARYFCAYNMLLPYIESDSRARLIVKIICLRYLWIDRLDELCKLSYPNDFSLVCAFFMNVKVKGYNGDIGCSDNMYDIYVEDDEYDNMREIVNFMNKDFNAVKRYLGKAGKLIDENKVSVNLRDKILLMQARLSGHNGNKDEAQYYYDRIHNQAIIRREEYA